jgi:hypothetical protein
VSGTARTGVNMVFKKVYPNGDITVWVNSSTQEIGVDSHVETQRRLGNEYVGRYATFSEAMGVATNSCAGLPISHNIGSRTGPVEGGGTCQIHEMGGQGDWVLAFRQDGQGNHVNLYVFMVPGDEVVAIRDEWEGRPGFREIASTRDYQSAVRTAEHECIGRTRIR